MSRIELTPEQRAALYNKVTYAAYTQFGERVPPRGKAVTNVIAMYIEDLLNGKVEKP